MCGSYHKALLGSPGFALDSTSATNGESPTPDVNCIQLFSRVTSFRFRVAQQARNTSTKTPCSVTTPECPDQTSHVPGQANRQPTIHVWQSPYAGQLCDRDCSTCAGRWLLVA
jgi:hypothetical protein